MKFFLSILFFCSTLFAFSQREWKEFRYPNGAKSSEGYLEQGKPNGYWKNYYESGIIKSEGNRKDFLLDSTWKFFRANGVLFQTIDYRADNKHGLEVFFDSLAKPFKSFTYNQGIKEGEALTYFPNGIVQWRENYHQNVLEGKAFEYATDGRMITKRLYKNGIVYSEEKINRYNKEGKRIGNWVDLYSNGNTKEEGPYIDGLKNGLFKLYSSGGVFLKFEVYEYGILKENKDETEFATMQKVYDEKGRITEKGAYKNGKRQGQFITYDSLGRITASINYKNDIKISEGMYDSINREIGTWKYFYLTGELKSQGQFSHGKKIGEWKYFFPNGKVEQTGKYDNDVLTGEWKWYFPNGQLLRDEFYRKGKLNGHYIEYDSTGVTLMDGEFQDGLKQGKWIRSVNDYKEEGEYIDDERNGEWISTNNQGVVVFKGSYELGIPVGKHVYYYADGKVKMKGEYQAGEKEGDWNYYDETGLLENTINYKEGKLNKVDGIKYKE